MGDELKIDEIIKEGEDVDARDQFGARRNVDNELKPKLKVEFYSLNEWYIFSNNYYLYLGLGFCSKAAKSAMMVIVW